MEAREPPQRLDRAFETTRLYAEAVRNVAREMNVAFTDAWTALWRASGEDERSLNRYLSDGLHLNAEGYRVWMLFPNRKSRLGLIAAAGHI